MQEASSVRSSADSASVRHTVTESSLFSPVTPIRQPSPSSDHVTPSAAVTGFPLSSKDSTAAAAMPVTRRAGGSLIR